jgi:transposase-like protein
VLAAWGIGEDGRKVLLALTAGSKEDVETAPAFFQGLRARGLGDPLLVVSDGAPGIIRAIEECFARLGHANAAWRIACATSPPRSRPTCGPI